tara:strand:- start:72139 stop:72789 length:651 start_codon:yes stop_codon:yes gene_type:complete
MDGLNLNTEPESKSQRCGSTHHSAPCQDGIGKTHQDGIGKTHQDGIGKTHRQLPDSVADRKVGKEICRLLDQSSDALSVQDIQHTTGIGYSTVLNELRWLREADVVQRKRRPRGAGYLYYLGESAMPALSNWTQEAKTYVRSLLDDGYEVREAAEMVSERIGQRVTSKMVSDLKATPVEETIERTCSLCREPFKAKTRFIRRCDSCRRWGSECGIV